MTFPKSLWFRVPATVVVMVTLPVWAPIWLLVMLGGMGYDCLWGDDE